MNPVVKIFRDSSKKIFRNSSEEDYNSLTFELDKIEKVVFLSVPIPSVSDLTLHFCLKLTEDGYAVMVEKEHYDIKHEGIYSSIQFLSSPVKKIDIQNQIEEFLQSRNKAIKEIKKKDNS